MATIKPVTTEDLSKQVETLAADIARLTQTIGELASAKGDDLADTARTKARAARHAGEAQLAEMQDRALAGMDAAEDYVRRNPTTALGIAAGVGLLVGLMSARR